MSNTNTATALRTLIADMADLRRAACPEATDDEIAASIKASLVRMMKGEAA